jgi:hypothetical protein
MLLSLGRRISLCFETCDAEICGERDRGEMQEYFSALEILGLSVFQVTAGLVSIGCQDNATSRASQLPKIKFKLGPMKDTSTILEPRCLIASFFSQFKSETLQELRLSVEH